MRLGALSPIKIGVIAVAWPVVVLVCVIAYVLLEIWSVSEGSPGAVGFSVQPPPLNEGWPAYVILFGPPLALVLTWSYQRRRS